MITSLVYICYAISIVCLTFTIYNIYCYFTVNKANARFNIYKMLLNKVNSHKSLKSKVGNTIRSIILNITPYAILLSIIAFIIGSGVNMINTQISAVIALTQTVLSKDDDCPCYALCTGDKKIDEKSVYELLFGSNEYKKLVNSMELKENEKAEFDAINKGKDGKAKSDFIKEHINEAMVNNYKSIVGNNKNFRSEDGLDRTTMTQDELTKDLEKLLSDYKINGRNPNCECKTVSSMFLKNKCLGVKHYVEGWSWKTLWEPDKGLFGNTSNSSTGGKTGTLAGQATGQYAVTLDDGNYYWYHQSGNYKCGCTYCGNWSAAQWGASSKKQFGGDGCAVYSLAIGISNLVGRAVTPADVLSTLDSPINNGLCTTSSTYFTGSSGRLIMRAPVVNKLASAYGLHVEPVGHNIAEIDAILDKGGYVWGSWTDSLIDWCGNGTSHFMMIRKTDGSNYYCFTSCKGKCATSSGKAGAVQTMNYAIDKQSVISAMTPNQLYGFWADTVTTGTTSTDLVTSGNSWYSSAAALTVGTPTSLKVCEGTVALYTGLPWAPTADTYFYNAKQAAEDVNTYIGTQAGLPGGKLKPQGVPSTFHYGKAGEEASTVLDGVTCGRFAPSPCTVVKTYCDNFTYDDWKNKSTPDRALYAYNSRKYCAVLSDANGIKYFLPLAAVDAKAHTFPGGACQSHVRVGGAFDSTNNTFTVDLGDTKGARIQKWRPDEIASGFQLGEVEAGGHPFKYFQNNIELYGIGSTSEFSGYTLEGFIAW